MTVLKTWQPWDIFKVQAVKNNLQLNTSNRMMPQSSKKFQVLKLTITVHSGVEESHQSCSANSDNEMSIWTKLSDECFQQTIDSLSRNIKADLKAIETFNHIASIVCLIKWLHVSAHLNLVVIL